MKIWYFLKEVFEVVWPDDDVGWKPWVYSLILLVLGSVLFWWVVTISSLANSWISVLPALILVICVLRGWLGVFLYAVSFFKSFFPYTVTGTSYMFTHCSVDYEKGMVYWSRKFLTKRSAERFISKDGGLKLEKVDGKTFFVLDRSIN
jgi:hypothetical protein